MAIPLLVWVYQWPMDMPVRNLIATLMFIIFALTDWADGYLARKLNQTSAFGAFLDPVADKILVCASLLVLVDLGRVDVIVALLIIGREIAISSLREWMAQIGGSKNTAVHYIGKLKTVIQFLAILTLLFNYNNLTNIIGNILMLFAVLLTVISMFYYLEQAKKYIKNNSN